VRQILTRTPSRTYLDHDPRLDQTTFEGPPLFCGRLGDRDSQHSRGSFSSPSGGRPSSTDRFDHPISSAIPSRRGEWFANARAAIGNLVVRSGFASRASRTTHAQAKCTAGTKARRVPKFAELVDLYCDGRRKVYSLGRAAGVGSAVFVARCLFCGTRKRWGKRERFGITRSESAVRLG
jgi:hypothetical protein